MMHPDTELRFVSEEVGVGLFATKLIPKGTITWIKDELDIILTKEYIESLDDTRKKIIYKYAYEDNDNEYVLNWDHARYINHSFDPNIVDTAYDFELAARDIQPGEQLTCDYGTLGADEMFESTPAEGSSRTKVHADDYLTYYKEWDNKAIEAFKFFNKVEQPLKYLIPEKLIDKVQAVANGTEPIDSILTLWNDDQPEK